MVKIKDFTQEMIQFGKWKFLLAAAIDILVPKTAGVSVVSRNKVMCVSPGVSEGSVLGKFDQNKEFVGMIENRPAGKQ